MVPVFFGDHFFRLPIPPPPAGFPVHRRGVGVVFPVHRRGVVHATPRHRVPPFLPNRFSSTGLIPRRKWQLLNLMSFFMARRHAKEAAFDRASTPHVVKRVAQGGRMSLQQSIFNQRGSASPARLEGHPEIYGHMIIGCAANPWVGTGIDAYL
eukprot:EG_transcript_6857